MFDDVVGPLNAFHAGENAAAKSQDSGQRNHAGLAFRKILFAKVATDQFGFSLFG